MKGDLYGVSSFGKIIPKDTRKDYSTRYRIPQNRRRTIKTLYKTQTDVLGIGRWKTVHGQNPVYVNITFILREIVNKKQPVEIFDTKNDTKSTDAFFLFGIDSIMINPVVREEEVKSIICIASIEKKHQFSQDENGVL